MKDNLLIKPSIYDKENHIIIRELECMNFIRTYFSWIHGAIFILMMFSIFLIFSGIFVLFGYERNIALILGSIAITCVFTCIACIYSLIITCYHFRYKMYF